MFRISWLIAVAMFVWLSPAHAESDAARPEGEGAPAASVQYYELDAFTVTLYRDDAPVGALTARLVLQLHSDDARTVIASSKQKLRDAMLRELLRAADREARNGPKIDLDLVKRRMKKVAQRTLGQGVIDDVLVQALLRRGA
jgi:flagellar basal body-associated protein FliL